MISHQAGEFNTKVSIERLAPVVDATYGSKAETWVLFSVWWCKVNPVSGNEVYADQAVQAKANYKLDGPFIAGVTARMRVNDHGSYYDITSPPLDWDNRHTYMTLLAKAGVNRG